MKLTDKVPRQLVACEAGHGRGVYPCWLGYHEKQLVQLVVDFEVLDLRFPRRFIGKIPLM